MLLMTNSAKPPQRVLSASELDGSNGPVSRVTPHALFWRLNIRPLDWPILQRKDQLFAAKPPTKQHQHGFWSGIDGNTFECKPEKRGLFRLLGNELFQWNPAHTSHPKHAQAAVS